MTIISKIYLDTSDAAANVVTLKFEKDETVGDALNRITRKLKMQLSNEEVLEKYALILQGVPSAKYFEVNKPIEEYLNNELLTDTNTRVAFVRKSFKIVVIGFNMENDYINVDFCEERELERILSLMALKVNDHRVKDLYFVSALYPDKELNTQKSLIDLNLVHEDVLLLKSRKKKRKMGSRRIKSRRFKTSIGTISRTGSLSSIQVKGTVTKSLKLYLHPIIFYSMRWIEVNALDTPCIFQLGSSSTDVEEFRKTFDSGYIPDLDSASDPFVVCDLLKVGLNSLSPCLDFTFWERLNAINSDNPLMIVKVLTQLGTPNIHLLKHVCCFLNRVCLHTSSNRMNSLNLATIFIPLLCPIDKKFTENDTSIQFLQMLINNPELIPKKQHPPLINSISSHISTELLSVDKIKPFLKLTEEVQYQHMDVKLIGSKPHIFNGLLLISNYRLIFQVSVKNVNNNFHFLELPIASILSMNKVSKDSTELIILGKHFISFHLRFPTNEDTQKVYEYLYPFRCPQSLNQIFAFSYALFYEEEGISPLQNVLEATKTNINPEVEYSRQGLSIPSDWRFFACKSAFSYPRQTLIPSSLKEEQKDIITKAYFNSRFPTLVYYYYGSSGSILISSKVNPANLVSFLNSNSNQSFKGKSHLDEIKPIDSEEKKDSELINCIKELQPSGDIEIISCLHPTDLMKLSKSKMNKKMLTFTQINTIFPKIRSLILTKDYNAAEPYIKEWKLSLSEVILSAVSSAVDIIHGKSILFEDSDTNHFGTVSRIMILIDPFYRTIKGFQRLIEHVWIRFGFPFAEACSIDSVDNDCLEIGIFIHFIDSVWQIFKQYPSYFEFNEEYLIDLLNLLFSGCYGTFLSNNEKQAYHKLPITVSIWNHLSNNQYINPHYTNKDCSPLIPDASSKFIAFWTGFYLQWPSTLGLLRYNEKKQKRKVKLLNISNYMLSYIPESFFKTINIDNIEEINLSNNNFTCFPIVLGYVKNLKILNLSQNKIISLHQDIFGILQNLIKLTCLDLRGNNISYIDNSITILSSLKILHIGGNGEKADIDGIYSLISLNHLSLEKIGLTEIPLLLTNLTKLKTLSLMNNKLQEISLSLPKLKELNISRNNIQSNVNIIGKQLRVLDISFNNLENIPEAIILLKRLRVLKIHNNILKRIPPSLKKLTKLTFLDITNNKIKIIAPNLCTIKKLDTVRHTGNPIEFPPSHVVGKGTDVLLKFLEDRINRSTPHRRVRLLLVGQENVGKSSLCHYLKTNLPIQENISTDGIQINDWELKINTGNVAQPVEVKIWDFAGQEVYYSTHQLFLGGQSIYIVVWNIMSDERETKVRFWLESIKARTSGKSPVILVATHMDHELCTSEYIKDCLSTIEKKYCSRFPFIKSITAVSCSTGEGFQDLRLIIKSTIAEQKYIGNFIPSKYLFFEKELLYLSSEKSPPALTFNEFKDIASEFEIHNDSVNEAANYLQNWGSIIHHNDPLLKDMVILDPSWLVQVMATILTTKHRYIKDGILKHKDLIHIWYTSEYPQEFHPILLQLLEKFEVTYNLNNLKKISNEKWNEGLSLVPSILPKQRPNSIKIIFPEYENNIEQYSREYKFNFIPEGFINHLLVRIINQTIDCYYWRYGISGYFREDPSCKVLLELLPHLSILSVIIRGNIPVKYFLRIIDIIESFIESWFHLDVIVQVPCTHCFKNNIHPIHRFSFEKCKELAVYGESYVDCPFGSSVRMDVLVPDLSMAEVPKIDYSDIIIDKEIGKGGFATVYKANYNNNIVALKQIDIEDDINIEDAYSDFMRESWIMSGIQHPNIIKFIGLCSNPLCILTDFASNGNLFDFLHSKNNKIQEQAKDLSIKCKIMYDIAQGMHFLHNRIPTIIHADLKSPNILLLSLNPKDNVVAVVADFGLSRTWVPVLQGRQVDNPVWLAPEILCGKGYSESADVYAFGVILYEIFTLKEFFGEFTFMSALEDALMAGKRPPLPNYIEKDFKDLIEQCWHQEPNNRPTFDEIVDRCTLLIKEYLPPNEITLQNNTINEDDKNIISDFENQYLIHTISPLTNISNFISINDNDDIFCIENGFISIWNIYDSYLPEKQIPLYNNIILLEYFPKINDKFNNIICSIDCKSNIYIWDSITYKLLKKKSLESLKYEFNTITRIGKEELWISTNTGIILTLNIITLQPALSHITGFNESSGRISSSLRNIYDKFINIKTGIIRHSVTIDNTSIYNCFSGNELLLWLKNQSLDNDSINQISHDLLIKNYIVLALKRKGRKKKSLKKIQENTYYVIKSDIASCIKLSLCNGIPMGFEFNTPQLENAITSCIIIDPTISSRVWLGTNKGIILFDLIRCGVVASINIGYIQTFIVTDTSLWISEKDKGSIIIYNKYTLSKIKQIDAHDKPITFLEYTSGIVWSTSLDLSIKIWSCSQYCLLENISNYHSSCIQILKKTTPNHILSASSDGKVAIWKYSKEIHWKYSTTDIEKLKYKYYKYNEQSDILEVKIPNKLKLLDTNECNYISLKLDKNGILNVFEQNIVQIDQLYEQLSQNDSSYVLYSYPKSSVILFYLYNPTDAPQSHQTLYNELFESIRSIIESIINKQIKLSFIVEHASQLTESYILYQISESLK